MRDYEHWRNVDDFGVFAAGEAYYAGTKGEKMMELPIVVQALMVASFLFGLLAGCAIGAGSVAFYAAREFSHRCGGAK